MPLNRRESLICPWARCYRSPEVRTRICATTIGKLPVGVRRDGSADVIVDITQDGLVSRVQRGENHGRTLTHDAVVRLLMTAGPLSAKQRDAKLAATVRLDPSWKSEALRVVAFVQEAASRRIVAASSAPLQSSHFGLE